MSTRSVIPAMQAPGSPSKQSLEMLEARLQAAGDETMHLMKQLGSMGSSGGGQQTEESYKSYGFTSPMKSSLNPSSFEVFKQNYETILSRVCKIESVLQGLKLNFVNLQGDRSLTQQQTSEFKAKLQYTREVYEQEIGSMTRQIELLKTDLQHESESKEQAVKEIKELQMALGEASATRMEAAMQADGLSACQTKLHRKLTAMKEEKEREQSLRASLEESHNTLLTRVREMETVVEMERTDVQRLTEDCALLRVETEKLQGEVKEECRRKQVAESSYKMLAEEKDKLQENFKASEGDRQLLMSELKRLREQYEELIRQMEQTQSIIDKQQEIFVSDKYKTSNKVAELATSNKDLVAQNDKLTETLRSTNAEHDRLIQQYKRDLDIEKQRSRDREEIQDEALRLKSSVEDLDRENSDLKKKLKRSEDELNKLKTRYKEKDDEFSQTADGLERELTSLRQQMQQLTKDKDRTLKDKESLLEEVNQTVDSMMEERNKLQAEVQQLQLQVDSHGRARRQLEHENAQLLERVAGFEQQQAAQKHVENTLKEMMEQKNKMAYENGRLQTQVEQTTLELEMLRKADIEATHYRKLSDALQAKYGQCETEISELKITIERLDSQLKQAQKSLDSRAYEFSSVSEVKEDLTKENQKLLTQLQASQDREKRKVRSLQKSLEDAKTVNKEIAGTLESVMSSHSQLQSVVENLQTELGKKDSHIARLKNEKNRERNEWKTEIRNFEEKMQQMRADLTKERDKSYKKTNKDLSEIKKQNDSMSSRNMELTKSNTDLRQKTRDMETTIQELRDKLVDQKRKMEYLHKAKKDLEENVHKMKGMRTDISELEQLRDQYMKKNQEQAEMISTFMGQINSLQTELRQLASVQSSTHNLVRQKEAALEKEQSIKAEMEKKYKETKLREEEIAKLKKAAEKRLAEVHDESLEISGHLQTAHDWFKDKFDNLQKELVQSKQTQEMLEKDNNEQKRVLNTERRKAQAAADKAKEMIQASRHTINRLSEYADLADRETQDQLAQLYEHLQLEKDHSKYLEMKHQRYQDASVRQFERLLEETDD